MIIVQSTFNLIPEFRDKAVEEMKQMAKLCVAEHGCLSYEYFQGIVEPNKLVLLQEWQDGDCLQAHYQTDHMASFVSKLGDYLESGVITRSFVSSEEHFASTAEEEQSQQDRVVH